ncbi:translation elongation factor Ts [Sinanaerobacter chloroacetimidivorans]|jgi:elongation factor Ts|uniref:Elongation factor Ts n=1 Tax=Sinanaerobacter chloroacetimidivorans TaxID=2818044 RepID=A0A8J7W024_9FIRM|nr:translation elongation factor Ts [Sinanaerobacter chloroacetimidivorans]MBR0596775.1 elongation factor Ts [Sinanaerobacter chloroacetimidivorans]
MEVTASLVKELRERTGAGMMDCKKVLVETSGDMDKAIELLREKGLAKAAKKAGRVASQGLVKLAFSADGKKAAAVEVNSETDFVAKNEEFIEFVSNLADMALDTDVTDMDAFMALDYKGEGTVTEALNGKIAKIGENMNVRRFAKCQTPGVVYVGYSHGNGKIGVLVGLETEASADEVNVMGRDVAMQVASMNPKFIDESAVDPEYLESEKKILVHQALNEGKPADIVEKMVMGRLKKELKETCLLEQKFVKDGEISVGQYVANCSKEIGKPMKVVEMIRYEVGEGIEKKEENFAEEVAKQMNS